MTSGEFLKKLRENRGLSLREVASLCGRHLDHAYIYRLETGKKTAPSGDIIKALTRALKVRGRELMLFKFLAKAQKIDDNLAEAVLDEKNNVTPELLETLGHMKFRGQPPRSKEEWEKKIEQIRELL